MQLGLLSFCDSDHWQTHSLLWQCFVKLCDTCLSMGSKDNMTAIVVQFEGQKVGSGGGVSARRAQRNSSDFPTDDSSPVQT